MEKDKNVMLVSEKNLLDTISVNVLCAFEFEGNKYIIYEKNERDYDDNMIVYSGKIEIINDKQYIKNLDKEEYEKIKDIIKKMVNYNGDE